MMLITSSIVSNAYADDYSIFGGIKRDEFASKAGTYVYEEMCFMTSSPVLLRGTVVIPKKPDKDSYTVTLKYALTSADKNIKLDRSVTYMVEAKKNEESNQVISNYTIKSGGIKETVDIGGKLYTLTSYDFDNSIISDIKASGGFKEGSLHYKKVFNTKEPELDEGEKITITGDSLAYVSYHNIWSSVNNMVVEQKIEYETLPSFKMKKNYGPQDEKKASEGSKGWQGTVKYIVTDKSQSKLDYVKNTAKNTSFRKGLLKSTNYEYNVSYEYNMPGASSGEEEKKPEEDGDKKAGIEDAADKKDEKKTLSKGSARKEGMISLDSYIYDRSTMLPVPKYKDVGNHWAEEDIFKMASLGGFDLDESFFPDVYITRGQFARAILNAIDSVEVESKEKRRSEYIKSTRPNAKKPLFEDVPRDSDQYVFVEEVFNRGMMKGEGNSQFLPNRPLTRQEAITIMIRALGVDDIAPSMPFPSLFIDDKKISAWAKPSIYQAVDLGIIKGYEDETIKPRKLMTRAEASHMLVNYIEHLRKEIPKDYKDILTEEY